MSTKTSSNRMQMRHSLQVDLLSTYDGGKALLMSPMSIGDSYRSAAVQDARQDGEMAKGKMGKELNEERRNSIPSIATIADMAPKIVPQATTTTTTTTTTKTKRRSSNTDLPDWWKARIAQEREQLLQKSTVPPTGRRVSWHATQDASPKKKTSPTNRRPSMVVDVDMLHEQKYVAEKQQEVKTMRHRTLLVGQLKEISLAKPVGAESITPSKLPTPNNTGDSMIPTLVGGLVVAVLIALDMTGTI